MRSEMLGLLRLMVYAGLCAPTSALAWGGEGHRVIAEIAERRLDPEPRTQVMKLLALEGAHHMADVASWADQVKHDVKERPAHTLRLPLASDQVPRDACPNRFCVVDGIERYLAVLRDRSKPAAARLEALKYVIHLTGDAHQPLHTAQMTGSKVKITFDGQPTTLHKVWDRSILETEGGDERTLASRLIVGGFVGKPTGAPLQWAVEGRNIARDRIFSCLPTRSDKAIPLDDSYMVDNWPIVRSRLAAGGARLAGLLNSAL